VVSPTKQLEQDLYQKWKKTQDPEHFQGLYGSMKNLLYDAAKKASYGSNLPESAHRIWAAQNFFDALRTFDPKSGASLQTHVYNAVHQKAKRLNYMYQNLGYIPEPRAAQVGLYQTEYMNLRDNLGREPTPNEMADRLSWNIKDVVNIQKEIQKDLGLGEGTEEQVFFESSSDEELLEYIYQDLAPEEQLVYDYIFGKHGKPRLVKANNKIDFGQMGAMCGFSASKARTIVTKIKVKLKKALER
jgi:DNA-directed RNA polymerase specialized sigma subunit